MGMRGGLHNLAGIPLNFGLPPIKPQIKRIFWHTVWWVPGRAPRGGTSSLGSRMKIQELGFNPFKLSSVAVSAPISVQQFCPFTSAVDQVWAGVDLWAAPLAESSSWLCVLQGIIISEALSSCQIPKHSLVRGHSAPGALISVFCSRQAAGSCLWCCACSFGAAGAALPHQRPSTGAADEETNQN